MAGGTRWRIIILILACFCVAPASGALIIAGDPYSSKPEIITNPRLARTLFPTGSIFKIVLLAAALESGIALDQKFHCNGEMLIEGRPFRCSVLGGHGKVDLEKAFASSCNLCFVRLGKKLGEKRIRQYARLMGFTIPSQGIYVSSQLSMARLSSGEEGPEISPLQAFKLLQKLATHAFPFSQSTYERLEAALARVFVDGTARSISPSLSIAGKTGTPYPHGDHLNHSGWFLGYSPSRNPTRLIVVYLKHGTGLSSASIAVEALSRHFQQHPAGGIFLPPRVRVCLGEFKDLFVAGPVMVHGASEAFLMTSAFTCKLSNGKFLFLKDSYMKDKEVRGPIILQSPEGSIALGPSREVVTRNPGTISLHAREDKIQVISELRAEEYLEGVVGAEMPGGWEEEALAAQAVLSRTFCISEIQRHRREGFDFCSLTHCQAYRPLSPGQAGVRLAVRKTSGLVLLYAGNPVKVYYHSTCGGKTSPPEGLYAPYLKGVSDPYCAQSPFFRWESLLSWEDIKRVLAAGAVNCKKITGLKITGRDREGRVVRVLVSGEKEASFSGDDLLAFAGSVLGWGKIPSSFFSASQQKDGILLEGRGCGHGTGLCQWGAQMLAKKGKGFKEILNFYFPGTTLARAK